jgi:hemophore-related protein
VAAAVAVTVAVVDTTNSIRLAVNTFAVNNLGDVPMMLSTSAARRAVACAIGAGAIVGVTCFAVPSASAAPPPPPAPGCSAGDYEQITSEVSAATSAYFFSHPDVNAFFSTLKGRPKDQTKGEVATYFDGNPQAKTDLAGIRQPLHDFKTRCQ